MRHYRHATSQPTPLSISILGFLVLAFVIGTVAVVSEPSFDIREQAYVPQPIPTALLVPDYQGLIWQRSLSGQPESQEASVENDQPERDDSQQQILQPDASGSDSEQANALSYQIMPEVSQSEARVVESAVGSVLQSFPQAISQENRLIVSVSNRSASSVQEAGTAASVSAPSVIADLKSTVSVDLSLISTQTEQAENTPSAPELNTQIAGAIALNKVTSEITSSYCPKVTCTFSQAVAIASAQDGVSYDDRGLKTGREVTSGGTKVEQTIYTDISFSAGKIVAGGLDQTDTHVSKVVAQALGSNRVETKVTNF